MTGWRTVQLGVALELAYGKALPKSVRAEGGLVPVYGSNGVAGSHDEVLVGGPTVIVGRKGSAGAVHYVDGPCYPIDTTYFVRPRAGFDFDMKFLFYLLRKLDLARLRTATGVPGLTREDVYREAVPVPPIEDQRRIVDLLSRAEGIVRLRREAQKKAAEIIPALFLDMFGDPATNPKGWPTASFGDLVVNRDGARRPVKSADRASRQGQYPYYGASGVIDFVDQYIYDGTHLLIAEDGANLVSRSTPIAFKATGRYWVNNHAHVVAQKAGTDLSYLEVALNLRDLRDFITGSAQPKLTQANLNAILVAVPPAKEQARFAELTTHLLSIQEQQANALSKAEKTFSALLARAFSESRLTGSQLPAEEIAA